LQDGGRSASWICRTRLWTIHEEHFMVSRGVQNLVEISAVVLMICKFSYFACFLENAYSSPKIGVLGAFDPILNGKTY